MIARSETEKKNNLNLQRMLFGQHEHWRGRERERDGWIWMFKVMQADFFYVVIVKSFAEVVSPFLSKKVFYL